MSESLVRKRRDWQNQHQANSQKLAIVHSHRRRGATVGHTLGL